MDIEKELAELKQLKKARRKTSPFSIKRRSALDMYRAELVALHKGGASYADLSLWLKSKKRVSVHRQTVHKRFQVWGVA